MPTETASLSFCHQGVRTTTPTSLMPRPRVEIAVLSPCAADLRTSSSLSSSSSTAVGDTPLSSRPPSGRTTAPTASGPPAAVDGSTLSPRQRRLLAAARARDLASLAIVDALAVDAVGEVPTDALLAVDASLRNVDRRRLYAAARVLPHLPSLRAAVEEGRASFDLAAEIARVCRRHRLTVAHLALLDDTLSVLLAERCDADDLLDVVADHVVALRPDEAEAFEAAAVDQVTYLPRLFGGGEIHVEASAVTYPLLTGAIDHVMARDDLLDRSRLVAGDPADDTTYVHNHTVIAEARGAALASIASDALSGRSVDGTVRPPVPSLQVVVPLDALVDDPVGGTDTPARVLTGGRMTASTLRALVDRDGADVTAIVVDDATEVVGVGRRTRVAPGWLDRLTCALQPRCVMPGCRARVTDLDHATRWADGGRTDLDNLARLCRRHHVAKDRDRTWTVQPDASGTVIVTNTATGWTATTRPPSTGPPLPPRRTARRARRAHQPRLPLAPPVPTTRAPPGSPDDLPY